MISNPDQRIGVFIDTQNMYHSARHLFKRRVNFGQILEDAVGDRKLIRAMAYVITTKSEEERPFFEALHGIGIETREKEIIEFASGEKKADWDVGLAVDVMRMLDMLDVVVLVSGDGDFAPLGDYIKSRGRIFEVMSFGGTTASKLLDVMDVHTDLGEDKNRYLIGATRKSTKHASKSSSSNRPSKPDDKNKQPRKISRSTD